MTSDQQLQKFNDVYTKLNTQQQQAVNTITGAVMVIAGPGTGKTQILGARIGKILLETDTLPQNILCLTYTDAGTIAMRKRLLSFIGADAYKVHIHTFHSFCNEVIQDNLHLFEKTSLNPISDLEKIELYKKLIDNFKKDNPLKRYRGDVYYEISNLSNLFSNMKREGWTKNFLTTCIEKYIADLPFRDEFIYKKKYKEFNAGDLKQSKIDEEVEKMTKLKAAVNEFENFQTLMKQKSLYDFDDMINWVIKAFEENPSLLDTYSSQYNHILVDEYQDTSGTQNKIINLLYQQDYTESIFVVGDDDQSIYRFQGANVENMLGFANSFAHQLQTVVLTNNYRSVQPILDISKAIIEKNNQRLVSQIPNLSKDIVAANDSLIALNIQPQILECTSEKDELIYLTTEIESLINKGVQPKDIAVIYKENKYGEALALFLKQKNISYYSKRQLNIFNEPIIQQLILLLNYLAAEHDRPYEGDEMLFEILHFNFFNIKPIDIAKLSVEVAARQFGDKKTSIRELLFTKANAPAKDLFDSNGISKELKNASVIIEQLIQDVSNETLQTVLGNIITNTGLLATIMTSSNKHFLLKIITALFDFVKNETSKNTTLSLQQLVTIIDLMQDENLALPLIDVSGNDKGVNLLTAHGSKGLEFEYVFVAATNAHNWEKKRKPNSGYKLPDTVFENNINANAENDSDEELRRLFYVALTRAAKHLYITYATSKNDGKLAEPSMFIAEIKDAFAFPTNNIEITVEQQTDFALLQFTNNAKPQLDKIEEEFVTPLVEKFVMNVTALNNYLKCPLQFYYNNIVRVPSGRNEATEFGSAVHHALDQLFKKMQASGNNTFPAKEIFIQDFEWYLNRHRENFTKEQFARRLEYGNEILSNYYDYYVSTFNKIVSVERSIRGVIVDGVPLKGKLDKLEFDGNNINVVDYKTGNYDKAKKDKKTFDTPNEKMPLGGDYWRQAVFYKILLDNNTTNPNWNAVSAEFDFIEPDEKKVYRKEKLIISPADITTVKEQIKTTWQKIQAKEFYTGCGKEDCKWCNFVKTNELAVGFEEEEVEV
ncbi:MAG: ATP-dependent DNA helicase [Bacteroidetes bacterium]|nr:ATP-dependent DNA helicase [Bacteroidota bacterium]